MPTYTIFVDVNGILEEAIERRYYESLENLKVLMPVCDEINIYDNTKKIEEIACY